MNMQTKVGVGVRLRSGEKLKLLLSQPSIAGTGTELGNKICMISSRNSFITLEYDCIRLSIANDIK